MWDIAVSGYERQAVVTALHAASVAWNFRYDLLAADGALKGALDTVESCTVSQDVAAKIHRTLRLSMTEDPRMDPLSDRVRPWARLRMPDGGYAEWPLGTFLLTTPPRQMSGGRIVRQIAGYDLGQILTDDKLEDRYTLSSLSVVTAAIAALLSAAGITAMNVQPSPIPLPATQDWKVGTSRADVIAALLTAINYAPLWFDAMGVAQVLPWVDPAQRPVGYTYLNDDTSVMLPGIQQGLDLFAVPNVFVAVTSEADRLPLRSEYVNANATSPTSTVSRGRRIVAVSTVNAADQASLDGLVARTAAEASQVYETLPFSTGLMPFHADDDLVAVVHSKLGVSAVYRETGWTMTLKEGGTHAHQLRRLVTV